MELELPKGMRDFPPEEKILRDNITRKLIEVFERYGFNPLETPIVERYDVLTSKYGASNETDVLKEVYSFTDQGGRQLGLRYELTLSTARFVGMNPNLRMPFKRYQIGDVFRDGPIKLGRYREFTQCDVDTFGCKEMTADAEILQLIIDAFNKLGLDAYVQVNNRKLLNGIIRIAGIPEGNASSAMIIIDKLEKQGEPEVRRELEQKGFPDDAITKLFGFLRIQGTNEQKLMHIATFIENDTEANEGLNELRETLAYLHDNPEGTVIFNPALARGLAYYTGTVFEGYFKDAEVTSSICGGGRYDKMVGHLLNGTKEVPAVGVAFGLEPITEQMKLFEKKKEVTLKKTVVDAYVIPIKCYKEAVKVVQQLRAEHINADIDLASRGISKNLDHVNAFDIPYAVIIGVQELTQGKLKLRNMHLGTEEMLTTQELILRIKNA